MLTKGLQITLQCSNSDSRVNSINHLPAMPSAACHDQSLSITSSSCCQPGWALGLAGQQSGSALCQNTMLTKTMKHGTTITDAQIRQWDAERNRTLQPEEKGKGTLLLSSINGWLQRKWRKISPSRRMMMGQEAASTSLEVGDYFKVRVVKYWQGLIKSKGYGSSILGDTPGPPRQGHAAPKVPDLASLLLQLQQFQIPSQIHNSLSLSLWLPSPQGFTHCSPHTYHWGRALHGKEWRRAHHPHTVHVLLHDTSSYSPSEHLLAPLLPSIPTATSIHFICIQSHSLETSQLFYSDSFASVPILTLELCND